MTYEIDHDALYPRTPAERYRIYERGAEQLRVLATAASMEAVGCALGQLHEDARSVGEHLGDDGPVGVYDAIERDWILSPFRPRAT